jgi:hypothetical protein
MLALLVVGVGMDRVWLLNVGGGVKLLGVGGWLVDM